MSEVACAHGRLTGRFAIEGECWLWTGKRNQKGYGRLVVDGRYVLAHRLSWEFANGPIPDGLYVLHRCDTPPCINPCHLFLGTLAENNADMKAKGRERKAVGESHPWVKLTETQVREIRARRLSGELTTTLAAEFGVHDSQISRIARGVSRAHDGM